MKIPYLPFLFLSTYVGPTKEPFILSCCLSVVLFMSTAFNEYPPFHGAGWHFPSHPYLQKVTITQLTTNLFVIEIVVFLLTCVIMSPSVTQGALPLAG